MESSIPITALLMSEFPSFTQHEKNVRSLPCRVSGRTDGNTIHHCHGGTMREYLVALGMDGTKGAGRRGYGPVLILPLQIEYHSIGPLAIDGDLGRIRWEQRFGKQVQHLCDLSAELGYDVWEMHRALVNATFKKVSGRI